MKKTFSILSMTVLLLMAACQKDQQQPAVSGSISGTLTTYDPTTPLVTTPLEGIKLWLVDYDYPFDTLTYTGNEAAIIDSTFSDARGSYNFSNLNYGNYAVAPVPDTAGYRFEPTDPELTIVLTEADPSKEVSYSAAWPGVENTGFTIHITVVPNGNTEASYFHWGRQEFYFFIPEINYTHCTYGSCEYPIDVPSKTWERDWIWGYTKIWHTLTNNFLFDFYDANDVWLESYWITQDLSNTPAESWWTIDLAAHTITKTEKNDMDQ